MRVHRLCMTALLALATHASSLGAQEESAPPPPHSLKPQPALEAPLAAHARLIDLVDTGERLIAVGARGNIVVSADGAHWQQVPSPVNIMLTRVRFLDPKLGWIVGHDGAILHSSDGGNSWKVQRYSAEARQLYDILMLDSRNGIAVGGYGTYLTTTDGGVSWTQQQFPLADLGLHFNTLLKLGDGTLFMAGEKSLMAWSDDNGASWQMLNSPYTGSFFGAVPLGARGVLVYGMRGRVYVADDATRAARQDPARFDPPARVMEEDPARIRAMGWRRLEGGLHESMFGATPLPDGEVLLVGVNGLAQKTRLADGTLLPVDLPLDATLSDVTVRRGQLLGVGKRGVARLGAAG